METTSQQASGRGRDWASPLIHLELNDEPPEEPTLPEDPAGLSFHIAGSIECDLGVKQRLLAERSTAGRVKALMMLLPLLNSKVEKGITVHRRAHTNGKGGMVPDVFTSS